MKYFTSLLKGLLIIVLLYATTPLSAQNYQRLLTKGKFKRVERKLHKAIAKDQEDVRALYYFSKFYMASNNPKKDFVKAYDFATLAEFALEKVHRVHRRGRYAKENITTESLKENRLSICRLELEDINKKPSIDAYNLYIKKYQFVDTYKALAIKQRDSLALHDAEGFKTEEALNGFLDTYPMSDLRGIAVAKRDKLVYNMAVATGTVDAFENFLSKYPNSKLVGKAVIKRDSIAYTLAEKFNSEESYNGFLAKYPNAIQTGAAKSRLDDIYFHNAIKDSSISAIEGYLSNHGTGKHVQEAVSIRQQITIKMQLKASLDSANNAKKLELLNPVKGEKPNDKN